MRGALLVLAMMAACAGPMAAGGGPAREAVTVVAPGGDDAASVAEELTRGVRAVLPDGLTADETALFRRYDEAGAVLSASPLADLDFSGVGWGPGPVVTMITDRHAIVSAHVPKEVGAPVRLVTRGGWPVMRTVAAKAVLAPLDGADLDIALVRLDAPVPAGVAVYPLAAMERAVFAGLAGREVPVIATYAGRRATVSTLRGGTDGGARLMLSFGARGLGVAEAAGHRAAWGDSGHPVFVVVDGRLALLSHTHTSAGAGAGPNYSDARVQAMVTAAVEKSNRQ